MPQRTLYTTDFQAPDFIVRGRSQTLEMPLRYEGALVAPTSGTVTVSDANGDDVVSAASVSVVSSIATYALSAATVPASLSFSDLWRETWTLLVSGETVVIERPAALVRDDIYPVISVEMINARHSDLNAAFTDAEVQTALGLAWDDVMARLMDEGREPYRILSPQSLREVHRCRTFHLLFTDMWSSSSGGKYRAMAGNYDARYEAAWNTLRVDYDANDDGVASPEERRRSGSPVLLTGGMGGWYR